MRKNEVVIIMGYPGMGKSQLARTYEKDGYFRLNRDLLGVSLDDLVPMMEKEHKNGKTAFVLDNTYASKESRASVVSWAKERGIPVKCVWITSKTPKAIEVAQYNVVKRMLDKYGKVLTNEEMAATKDPNVFPPVALFAFKKKFERPTKQEGFDELEVIYFKIELDKSVYKNKAVVFDYDGTLRKTKSGEKVPTIPDDVELLENRKSSVKRYLSQGYILLGVSNQSFVGKGVMTEAQAIACFEKTNELLGVDIDYKFCPHNMFPINCYCRKPMPGLGVDFTEKYKLDPDQTIVVGDRTTDKTFARRSGFTFVHADDFFAIESKLQEKRAPKTPRAKKTSKKAGTKKTSNDSPDKKPLQKLLLFQPRRRKDFKNTQKRRGSAKNPMQNVRGERVLDKLGQTPPRRDCIKRSKGKKITTFVFFFFLHIIAAS